MKETLNTSFYNNDKNWLFAVINCRSV